MVKSGGGSQEPGDPGPRQEAAPRDGVRGLRAMPGPEVRSRRGSAEGFGAARGDEAGRGLAEGGRAVREGRGPARPLSWGGGGPAALRSLGRGLGGSVRGSASSSSSFPRGPVASGR